MELLDLIMKDPVQFGIFVILLVGFFTVIIVLLVKIVKKRDITISKNGVELKQVVDKEINQKFTEYDQLRTLYDDQRDEINREIWELERNGTMEKYMILVEDRLQVAVKAFRETHELLVCAKIDNPKDIAMHPDVRRYTFIMRNVYWELKETFRSAMRRNGFTKKSTDDLNRYALEKLEVMFKMVETLIDTDYSSDVVSIQEIREAQRANAAEYGKMLMGVFIEAKAIAVRVQAEADMLKKARRLMQETFTKNREILTVENAKAAVYGTKHY